MKTTIRLKLMETKYGDKYLVRNFYRSYTQGLKVGDLYWETVPGRNAVTPDKLVEDKEVWGCEMPIEVWDKIAQYHTREG